MLYLATPFGGGQIRKAYQGATAAARGGSYTVDNEGRDILQYPVYNRCAISCRIDVRNGRFHREICNDGAVAQALRAGFAKKGRIGPHPGGDNDSVRFICAARGRNPQSTRDHTGQRI